jgi:hypothetical protein
MGEFEDNFDMQYNDYLQIKNYSERIIIYNHTHDYNKINMILDLDQTLIDCEFNLFKLNHEIKSESKIVMFNYDDITYIIHGRNNLFDFIYFARKKFNIYIYTNAIQNYTEKIIECVENYFGEKIFSGFVCRDDYNNNNYIKKLEDLHLRNLTIYNTIIIDDRNDIWDKKYHDNIIRIIEFRHTNYNFDDELSIIKKLLIFYEKYIDNTNMNKIIPIIYEMYKNYDVNKQLLYYEI